MLIGESHKVVWEEASGRERSNAGALRQSTPGTFVGWQERPGWRGKQDGEMTGRRGRSLVVGVQMTQAFRPGQVLGYSFK